MTDPTTTPTPTNEQQDARAFDQAPYLARALNWASIDALANTPDYVLAEKLAGCPHLDAMFRAYLAAVSAAAPDERGALDHDALVEAVVEAIWPVSEPEGPWPRREGIYAVAERVIALAARPAPVVGGEAVEAAARRLYVRTAKDNTTHDEAVVPWADLHSYTKDRWLDYARDALTAALGIPVADAPAADDEGGQE